MKANKITERIKVFFSTNIKLKIFSVIAAFAVWFVVMGTLNPAEVHMFSVSVNVTGEDELKENNLICTNIDSIKNQTVGVRIKASRADLGELSTGRNNVSATVDLGRFSDYYNEDLSKPFYASVIPNISVYSNAYEIVGYTPSGLNVELDRLTEFEVPVRVVVEKDIGDGFVRDELIPSVESISVRGPEKLADSISYAGLPVDLSAVNGERVLHVRPVLYTDGGALASDNFEVLSPAIEVSAVVRRKGEITIQPPQTTGNPAPGYTVADVTVSPDTVSVVSDNENIGDDPIELLPINVEGVSESFTTVVGIDEILNSRGLRPAVENTEVTVSVTIEREGAIVAQIKGSDISVTGLGPGLKLADDINDIAFEVYGNEDLIRSAVIEGRINLDGLGEGVYTVEVVPTLPPGIIPSGVIKTQIEIVKAEQAEPEPEMPDSSAEEQITDSPPIDSEDENNGGEADLNSDSQPKPEESPEE